MPIQEVRKRRRRPNLSTKKQIPVAETTFIALRMELIVRTVWGSVTPMSSRNCFCQPYATVKNEISHTLGKK